MYFNWSLKGITTLKKYLMMNWKPPIARLLKDILILLRITELETRAAMHLFIAQHKLNLDKDGKKRDLFNLLKLDGKNGVPKKILDMVTKDTE